MRHAQVLVTLAGLGLAGLVLAACSGEAGSGRAGAERTAPKDAAARLSAACSGCHDGPGAALASLEGRSAEDLSGSLATYRAETDGTSVMHRLARGYSHEEIELISAYLARQGKAG